MVSMYKPRLVRHVVDASFDGTLRRFQVEIDLVTLVLVLGRSALENPAGSKWAGAVTVVHLPQDPPAGPATPNT
jgi:hypothetical protein